MLKTVATRLFGTKFERDVKRLRPIVAAIHEHEERLASSDEAALRAQTDKFGEVIRSRTEELESEIAQIRETRRHTEDAAERETLTARLRGLEDDLKAATQAVLDEILPEAYATVREACRRLLGREIIVRGQTMTWDMVPYDVQLIGGIVLHQGKIAEMATGEGKTLVATLPLYLNALPRKGIHLVTVNDYLAKRDAEWMGVVFEFLGLTVGCLDATEPGTPERRAAYRCDITYGTNNEFGFDYLRDNMVLRLEDRVQRGHVYSIIDEVDSILIDEARTPLIISGPVGEEDNRKYAQYNAMVAELARRQSRKVNELVAQAEKAMDGADEEEIPYEAAEKLLAAQRGMPKHTRLMKLLQEPGVKKAIQRVEGNYMRDKRLHELDEFLLYTMDEKGHTVQVSDQGLDILSPNDHNAFIVPDLSEAVHAVEHDESLSVDEKRSRIATLEGEYAEKNEKIHIIHNLLKAFTLFEKDVEYVVENGQIIIVDEFTGRKMPGRRWSDGLHQAVEAKEGVTVRGETQTLATITIQNYFRMYDKLAGMTGTAETEESEFHQIYGLEVVVIPTNRPVRRIDQDDVVYKTKREKYNALLEEIERVKERNLPILVGTTNVEASELISKMLRRRGIPHSVLNAKYHEKEAEIVAQAGKPGAVTIATNMAGRGTDIKLGLGVKRCRVCGIQSRQPAFGQVQETPDLTQEEVGTLGCHVDPPCGLQILGTERHEARRIDRQLRGRSGRQGDPGASLFFLSLEDDLMRLFGSQRIASLMDKMGAEEGEVITHPLVTKSIERAQKRVEMQNFDARKRLLEYDDVMNQQREVIYDLRLFALEGGEDLKAEVWEMIQNAVRARLEEYAPEEAAPETWDLAGLRNRLLIDFFLQCDRLPAEGDGAAVVEWDDREELESYTLECAREAFKKKMQYFGDHAEQVLSWVVLLTLDQKWKDHLYDLDQLKAGIYYRAWGQKDPLIEYKKEAYEMFVDLMRDIQGTVADRFFKTQLAQQAPAPRPMRVSALQGPSLDTPERARTSEPEETDLIGAGSRTVTRGRRASEAGDVLSQAVSRAEATADAVRRLPTSHGGTPARQKPLTVEKVGRNDPCPCGSGKKYKKCHGANA